MKRIPAFITGVIIFLLLAAGAYFWATSLIDSMYNYRSPLQDSPPRPGTALGQPATHQVVFVLIDALRYDTSLNTNVMPVLNQLRQQGASARMNSRPPSFSEPGYSCLFIGAWPDVSDGPAVNLDYDLTRLGQMALGVGVYLAVAGAVIFTFGLALSIWREKLLQLPERIASREGLFKVLSWR